MATETPKTPESFGGTDALKWILILWGIACLAVVVFYLVKEYVFGEREELAEVIEFPAVESGDDEEDE